TQHAKPEKNAGRRYAHQNPEKCPLHDSKMKTDRRRQIENDVRWICESLLVGWVRGPRRIEGAPVVSGLNFARDLGTIRIPAMKKQFPRAQPARIEIGKIAARPVMCGGVGNLMRNQHAIDVSPHADSEEDRKQRQLPRTKLEQGRSR